MKKLLFLTFSSILILSACNNNNDEEIDVSNNVERKSVDNEAEKSESKSTSTDEKNTSSNKNKDVEGSKEKETEPLIKKEELTKEQIIAMTLFDQTPNDYGHYIVPTGEDFLNHEYTKYDNPSDPYEGDQQKEVHEVSLIKTDMDSWFSDNPPYNLDMYSIQPENNNANAIIGITNDRVILFGTQAIQQWETVLEHGNEYFIDELYENYKDDERVNELVNMIVYYDNYEEYSSNSPNKH